MQPGIKINYATGYSSRDGSKVINATTKNNKIETKKTDIAVEKKGANTTSVQSDIPIVTPSTTSYIANKNTKKFHIPTCSSVGDMAEHNKWYFDGTRDQLIEQGYVPCKRCHP